MDNEINLLKKLLEKRYIFERNLNNSSKAAVAESKSGNNLKVNEILLVRKFFNSKS